MELATLQLILIGIHFLLGFLFVFVFYKLLKTFFKLLFRAVGDIKTNALNLFISFGLVAIFFNKTIIDTINKVINFFIYPFTHTNILHESLRRFDSKTFSKNIFEYLNLWLNDMGGAVNNYLLKINFGSLIVFFTLWLLLSLIIREMTKSIDKSEEAKEGEKIISFFEKSIVKNVLTFFVIIFSAYLSVSSIIAVPEFQNLESISVDSSVPINLKKNLDEQQIYSKDELLIPLEKDTLSFHQISELKKLGEDLNYTIENFNSWINNKWINDEKLKKSVLNNFQSALDQKIAPRERAKYQSMLTSWYLSQHEKWVMMASYYQTQTLSLKQRITQVPTDYQDFLFEKKEGNPQEINFDKLSVAGIELVNDYGNQLRDLRNEFPKIHNNRLSSIPDKPTIGEKFGIFNTISGWLLKTESLSLALIVGLFGFGLLGSIASLFIRRRIKSNYLSEPVVVFDIPGVLVNGMSAAIVIFLAVKGAVVIFSTDGDNLNPYVLFFTCLVASVFSEDVWSWAREKLNDNLGNEIPKEE